MRDRDLVRLYWPVELRPAFDALMGIDDAMGEVVASTSQPALGAIRLAWWREALERLDNSPPPPEPRLQAVARELLPRGISGEAIGRLEAGWAAVLDDEPDPAQVAKRGECLFALGARLLDANDPGLKDAGRLFALADVSRRGLADLREAAHFHAARFPRALRPLTGFARLAVRDRRPGPFEPEASPGRALALLGHRLTGKIPKTD